MNVTRSTAPQNEIVFLSIRWGCSATFLCCSVCTVECANWTKRICEVGSFVLNSNQGCRSAVFRGSDPVHPVLEKNRVLSEIETTHLGFFRVFHFFNKVIFNEKSREKNHFRWFLHVWGFFWCQPWVQLHSQCLNILIIYQLY